MAIYYIDPSQSSNGTGTFLSPFNTYPTILAYGDSVLFKENTTIAGGWSLPIISGIGSETNLLTIGTYSALTGERLTDIKRQAKIVATNAQDGILVSSKDYVTISNLNLTGTRDFPYAGVRVLNSSYVTVEYCITESSSAVFGGCYGIRFDNATGSGAARSNWILRNNIIKKTTGNAGIICIWSSISGEYVSNIRVTGNIVFGNSRAVVGTTNDGISIIARAVTLYTDRGGLTAKGIILTDNQVFNTHAYGYKLSGISSLNNQQNLFARNSAHNIGDFKTDMHCMWFAACDLFVVENNYVNGSNAFIGEDIGSGVGIFIDKPASDLDGSTNFIVRKNICLNTGRASTSNSEVGGAGILVFLSSSHVIESNFISNCSNGIVTIGWYGSGNKTSNVVIQNNTVINSTYSNYYVCKACDTISLYNNVSLGSIQGYYIENSGSTPITSYTEENNLSWNAVTYNWCGGNAPTASSPTISERTPTASNITENPLVNTFSYPLASSPLISAGLFRNCLQDNNNTTYWNLPSIGAYEYIRPRAAALTRTMRT